MRHRLDHWLHLVCIFKHRSDAAEACRGGHLKVNGVRARPASPIREGDLVEITDEERYRRVVVLGLPEHSISKETARTMYRDETPARPAVEPGPVHARRDRGAGRPTKKERREIEKIRGE